VVLALEELGDIAAVQAEEGEITRVINAFLHAEKQDHADIFVKRYWYMMEMKDIAAQYGSSVNKITSLLFRMRNRLKLALESEGLL
jgi:RNA polymerase sigma-70 factor (ECF subfamily)